MEMSEFIERRANNASSPEELTVQKAVVESLAAEKVEQDERITALLKENNALKSENSSLKEKIDELRKKCESLGEVLATNADDDKSNKISLIDRNVDLEDRFLGETRDHVLEVLAEACKKAEEEGRIRRAHVLESVLVVNESLGNLAKKREKLVRLFNENGNVISGSVIEELEKEGLSHKNGDEYLLVEEIIKRNY